MQFEATKALSGTFDLGAAVTEFDRRFRTPGFLFKHAVRMLGEERYDAIMVGLSEPQVDRRYKPRDTYPTADHMRLSIPAAKLAFPRVESREAVRLWFREDVAQLKETPLGRLVMSQVQGPDELLQKIPELYAKTGTGPWNLRLIDHGERSVLFSFGFLPSEPAMIVGRRRGWSSASARAHASRSNARGVAAPSR